MENVLLVTDGFVHPPLSARRALHKLVEQSPFTIQHTHSMEKLPRGLEKFSAMILYFHHKSISEVPLARLDEFVSDGGGVLGIHTATASFKNQLPYFEILGGRFTSHGPIETIHIKPVAESEIFAGIPAFTIKDELYIHELQPGIEAHFTTTSQGEQIPAVWTYHYGKGRVCYAMPGHRTETMWNPIYQEVLQRGLNWVCGK